MSNIYLIEDHDEALKIWRKKKVRYLDLVHIDAHIDFGFHKAKPVEIIVKEAKNLKELKRNLEYSLNFMHYESDFDKQTDIGNYIYPAIKEGIVRNFYWVIPGGIKEFKKSEKIIKNMLKGIIKTTTHQTKCKINKLSEESVSIDIFERRFIICTIDKLPILKERVLLDVDTDFLITDSILNSNLFKNIGKRKPWISSKALVEKVKDKIKEPEIITIAYSVNGGFTPMRYKYIGDEIAYYFAPRKFKKYFENNLKASQFFDLFCSTHKKEYYWKAARLNPLYRSGDNNYGPLYLKHGKFSKARRELLRILSVDPKNPFCLCSLGNIALVKKDFRKAKELFHAVRVKSNRLSAKLKADCLWGLAKAEFGLSNFKKAKILFRRFQNLEPLRCHTYYFLGRIHERERDFEKAALRYQDALRLSFRPDIIIPRLLKISRYLKKNDIIKPKFRNYKKLKAGFLK